MISVFNGPSLLSADDFSSQDNLDDPEAGGWDATLTGEEEEEFFELQIVKHHDGEVSLQAGDGQIKSSFLSLSRSPLNGQQMIISVLIFFNIWKWKPFIMNSKKSGAWPSHSACLPTHFLSW
jgi:hypothetical protein